MRSLLSSLLQGLLVLLVLLTLTFVTVRKMPGSPLTSERAVPAASRAAFEEAFAISKPMPVQYAYYWRGLVKGDLGPSTKRPGLRVTEILAQAFPVSLTIGTVAMLISLALGIPAGVIAAARRNSLVDSSLMSLALLGICLPSFVIAPLIGIGFGIHGPLAVAGWGGRWDWILPALALGLINSAAIARLTRSGMLEVLGQDYIRTARAKGVPASRILIRHALRGGLIPVAAFIGPSFAAVISGSFVIESVFQIPGLGWYFVNAPGDRDYPLIQGIVLYYGLLIFVFNLISDLLVLWLDPRARVRA